MDSDHKLQQFCGDCVIGDCVHKNSKTCLPRCPADQSAALGDDVIRSLEPLACPVCGSLISECTPYGALLARASARISTLHPACLKCDGLFESCEGTSVAEWEARLNDPARADDAFCHQLAFWP